MVLSSFFSVPQQDLSKDAWLLPNPGTFTVTIRATGGRWSSPQRFGEWGALSLSLLGEQ